MIKFRKSIFIVTTLVFIIILNGCGNDSQGTAAEKVESLTISEELPATEPNTASNTKQDKEVDEQPRNENTTIKISTEIGEPVGDRTADNVGDEDGEYFAIGSDIVKCSDYTNIHIVAELTNNRDILLNTSMLAWSAKMEDGYELQLINNNNLEKQIQSGSTTMVEFDIIKEKSVKGEKVILGYWDVDFGEEFSKLYQEALGGMTEEEGKEKYPVYFDESLKYSYDIVLD